MAENDTTDESTSSPDGPALNAAEVPSEARTWGMLCHLTALSGYIGVGFGFLLGPLIVWLLKKNEMPFVDDQGKESLNFQITMLIAFVVLSVLSIIPFVFCVTIPLLVAFLIANLVFIIMASLKANDGTVYRYPFALRLIK